VNIANYDATYTVCSTVLLILFPLGTHADMRRLTIGIRSEKCVVRRFRCCAPVMEFTYTYLGSIDFYTPSLYIVYCS